MILPGRVLIPYYVVQILSPVPSCSGSHAAHARTSPGWSDTSPSAARPRISAGAARPGLRWRWSRTSRGRRACTRIGSSTPAARAVPARDGYIRRRHPRLQWKRALSRRSSQRRRTAGTPRQGSREQMRRAVPSRFRVTRPHGLVPQPLSRHDVRHGGPARLRAVVFYVHLCDTTSWDATPRRRGHRRPARHTVSRAPRRAWLGYRARRRATSGDRPTRGKYNRASWKGPPKGRVEDLVELGREPKLALTSACCAPSRRMISRLALSTCSGGIEGRPAFAMHAVEERRKPGQHGIDDRLDATDLMVGPARASPA